MKTSINLKTSKMKNNYLKLGMMAAVMLSASIGFAQTTTGDITVGTNAGLGTSGTTVKVIDNKGTVKYLQSNNGITTFTNDTPSGGVVTTWQLGGTLATDTDIDLAGNAFSLDNVLEINPTSNNAADIAAITTQSDADGTTTGYTFIVRDEATGALKKMKASDLITGIRLEYEQAINDATADVPVTVTGLPVLTAGTSASKLYVYRNGVKLRFGSDFVATADLVTITYNATYLPMYVGDIIEIQYLK
jgi:hypothetical protein